MMEIKKTVSDNYGRMRSDNYGTVDIQVDLTNLGQTFVDPYNHINPVVIHSHLCHIFQ